MFLLSVVTPQKKLITNLEVDEVIVPGDRGELDILPRHAPLMTTLNTGVLKYRSKGSSEFQRIAISWGYCEVNPQGVSILADTAETADELDISRAQNALKTSEEKLKSGRLPINEILKHQRKVSRARTRINLRSL